MISSDTEILLPLRVRSACGVLLPVVAEGPSDRSAGFSAWDCEHDCHFLLLSQVPIPEQVGSGAGIKVTVS